MVAAFVRRPDVVVLLVWVLQHRGWIRHILLLNPHSLPSVCRLEEGGPADAHIDPVRLWGLGRRGFAGYSWPDSDC